jgi:energy-converting hydrogenase Eha subunit E
MVLQVRLAVGQVAVVPAQRKLVVQILNIKEATVGVRSQVVPALAVVVVVDTVVQVL